MVEKRVYVIGAGMMGSGIAAMAALAGHPVTLVDVSREAAERGREKAFDCIRLRAENGLSTAAAAEQALSAVSVAPDISCVTESPLLVIEAIVEKLEAKQALFRDLDALLSAEIPLCSNTSGLRITDISFLFGMN